MTAYQMTRYPVPMGGRNKRDEGGRKHSAHVRMNDDEFAIVQARAIALGISVPRALLEATTGAPPLTKKERQALHAEMTGIKALLGNVANNVKQIAKALNSDADVPTRQIRAVLERATTAAARVDEFMQTYQLS